MSYTDLATTIKLLRSEGTSAQNTDSGIAVFVPRTGAYWYGNRSAKFIVEFALKGATIGELIDAVAAAYAMPVDQVQSDVLELVRQLLDAHVLIVAPARTPAWAVCLRGSSPPRPIDGLGEVPQVDVGIDPTMAAEDGGKRTY